MNSTLTPSSDRAAQFVLDALLLPGQVDDVALVQKKEVDAKGKVKKPDHISHAHGDFGHADR